MTKKDYELIARAIQKELCKLNNDDSIYVTLCIGLSIADELQGKNPLFNRDKFLIACGLKLKNFYPCERCGSERDCEARICNDCGSKENL